MRPLRTLRVSLCLTVAAGCAGQSGTGSPEPQVAVPVSIRVENQNQFAAEIFAYRNRQRTRLGVVESGRTLILPFTWDAPDVRFIIDLVGDEGAMSNLPPQERRNAFASDAAGDTVPCILTESYAVQADQVLALAIPKDLHEQPGRSRCAR